MFPLIYLIVAARNKVGILIRMLGVDGGAEVNWIG
jgi:hypothetical protein